LQSDKDFTLGQIKCRSAFPAAGFADPDTYGLVGQRAMALSDGGATFVAVVSMRESRATLPHSPANGLHGIPAPRHQRRRIGVVRP